MTIDEAIKILIIHNDHNPNYTDKDRREAHQLGIEALKRLQQYREFHRSSADGPLPGETEEGE